MFPIQDMHWWNHSSCSPYLPEKKSRCKCRKCRKWRFNDMLLPQARYEEGSSSIISTYISDFLFPRNLGHMFSKTSQSLLSVEFNIFLKSGSWKSLFTLVPTKTPQTSMQYNRSPCIEMLFSVRLALPIKWHFHTLFKKVPLVSWIQVVQPWFWGGSSSEVGLELSLSDEACLYDTVRWQSYSSLVCVLSSWWDFLWFWFRVGYRIYISVASALALSSYNKTNLIH